MDSNNPIGNDFLPYAAPNASVEIAAVCINSLLSPDILIDARDEKPWRISLVQSQGKEHVFLLLEGILDGQPVHFRSDYFMDCDLRSRAMAWARVPRCVTSAIRTLAGQNAGAVLGYGLVRTEKLTAKKLEKTLGRCEHQSWCLTTAQAEQLSQRLLDEAAQRFGCHKYSKVPGNHCSQDVSTSSGVPAHNCVSWCKSMLETVGIHVGSYWALVEYPSDIVRQAQQASAQPPSSPSMASSSSSSSSSSPSTLASLF